MMKQQIISMFFICITSTLSAQIHEVGIFLGGSNYVGDIGSTTYFLPNKFAGGLIYKYNLNPRIALRGTYSYLPISANDANASSPYRKTRGISFTNNIHEFAAGIEFNFFEYNISKSNKTFTPYIVAEAAVFSYRKPTALPTQNTIRYKNSISYTLPVGIGIKGALTDNIAFAVEAKFRYTLVDDLDFPNNFDEFNTGIDYRGNGNDLYMFTGVSLVYSFGRPPCYVEVR